MVVDLTLAGSFQTVFQGAPGFHMAGRGRSEGAGRGHTEVLGLTSVALLLPIFHMGVLSNVLFKESTPVMLMMVMMMMMVLI